MPRRRPELQRFATSMRTLRRELKLEQGLMATRLGISQRRLSDWENGYGLPLVKEQLHFLYRMNEIEPAWVDEFASLLGLRDHPGVAPLYADEEEMSVAAPPVVVGAAPIAPPVPAAPTREQLRAILDAAVREAADVVDVRASDLRRGVSAVFDALVETGVSIDDARAALGMTAKERAGTKRET